MSIKKIFLPNKTIRWEVCTRLPGHGRKKIRRRFPKKIDAQEFLDALKERRKDALLGSNSSQVDVEGRTFNEEADYWLEKKGSEFTKGYFRVIGPGLKKARNLYGSYKISRFTPTLLFEFRSYMKGEGLSSSTQNRYADLITRIVNFSYQQQRININPCLGYEKARENKDEMRFWNEDDVRIFLHSANNKYPIGSSKRWIYCVYLIALETGMRARELWGIKLKDIPQVGSKLRVLRQSAGGNQFEVTKGKDSRYVPFSKGLRIECMRLLPKNNHSTERTLFVSKNATAIDHDNFSDRVFKKDLREFGVRLIRFHDLLHTALTLMVKRGVLLPVVQKIAGHKDIKTTMRYVHVVGKDIDEIGEQFGLTDEYYKSSHT
tara:strand:+ start:1705 stop:2832 length:1128 start_codon:yes stop_codon:yes gene_type:complete